MNETASANESCFDGTSQPSGFWDPSPAPLIHSTEWLWRLIKFHYSLTYFGGG